MKFIISGKNIEVTEGIKAAIEEKLGRLDKYLVDDTIVNVTLSVQKGRQKIEVTIPMKGHIIRAEEGSEDMYVSIDLVVDVIERQIRRYKKKLIDKKQAAIAFSQAFIEDEEDTAYEDDIQIVKTKKFAMKPVNPEEACLQMEMLGHNFRRKLIKTIEKFGTIVEHNFFVFLNSETEQVNVVYKRKNGTYGLIEPEF